MGNDGFWNVPPGHLEVIHADPFQAALPILLGVWGTRGVLEGFQWRAPQMGMTPGPLESVGRGQEGKGGSLPPASPHVGSWGWDP